jgi:hypothetical protein
MRCAFHGASHAVFPSAARTAMIFPSVSATISLSPPTLITTGDA